MRNTPMRLIAASIMALFIAGAALAQGPFGVGSSQFRDENKYTFELIQTMNQIDAMNRDPRSGFDRTQAKQVLSVVNPLRKQSKLTQKQAQQAISKLKPVISTSKAVAWQKSQRANQTYRPGDSYRPDRTGRTERDNKSDTQRKAGQPNRDYRPDSQRKPEQPGKDYRPDSQRKPTQPGKDYRPDSQRRSDARGIYRPDFKPEQMKDFNPFYDKKSRGDSWQERQTQRMSEIISDIEKTSRGQKLSPRSRSSFRPGITQPAGRQAPRNSKPNEKYVPSGKTPVKK
ncbi:MAG: hypothetical protein ACOX3G_05845 [Armatimonadota bacterium]|jgi:hypothetical protein